MEQKSFSVRFIHTTKEPLKPLPNIPKETWVALRRFVPLIDNFQSIVLMLEQFLNSDKSEETLSETDCDKGSCATLIDFIRCYTSEMTGKEPEPLYIGRYVTLTNTAKRDKQRSSWFDEFCEKFSVDVYLKLSQYCWNFNLEEQQIISLLLQDTEDIYVDLHSDLETSEMKTDDGIIKKITPSKTKVTFRSEHATAQFAFNVSPGLMHHLGEFIAKFFPHARVQTKDTYSCFFNFIFPRNYFPDAMLISMDYYWNNGQLNSLFQSLRSKFGACLGLAFAHELYVHCEIISLLMLLDLDILLKPEHVVVFRLFKKIGHWSDDQLNYFKTLRQKRPIASMKGQLIRLILPKCNREVQKQHSMSLDALGVKKTLHYTSREECKRMRSRELSYRCSLHNESKHDMTIMQSFRSRMANIDVLAKIPIPKIPPKIPSKIGNLSNDEINSFVPYLTNYFYDCHMAALQRFFIITEEQHQLYAVVVVGLGSGHRSPWSDFLTRGLYDPRLLLLIMGFV